MSLACHSGKRWRRGSCAVCCAMWVNHACKPESASQRAARRRLGERHTRFYQHMRSSIFVPFGSLLVQRDQWNTHWGAKNVYYLIRDSDDATMAAAPVESCRFVVPEVSRRPLRVGNYIGCNRLRRLRRRFQIPASAASCRTMICQRFSRSSGAPGELQVRAHAA